MKHLLIVAHGSRREESNCEIRALANQIAHINTHFHSVECAFLEIATPSISEGLNILIDRGAQDIVVMPYFLSAGRHVTEDIPGEISSVLKMSPQVSIRLAPYLGSAEGIHQLILQQAMIQLDPT